MDQGQVARRLLESARTRDERVALFQAALGTEEARQQARSMGADPDRLRAAVPHLSDRELADLASRAALVKQDVAAGHHHERALDRPDRRRRAVARDRHRRPGGGRGDYDDDWDDDWDDCDCW